jgi:hypothetical protein
MYDFEPARAILVGGGFGKDAKALIDAATFCNHPMVYLVPGFHPTSVDNIKRNDFAVACFLSFTFGWLIRPNMARRAFERDPLFSAALAIQNAEHLRRIAALGGKAQAASGMLAEKASAGGKAQAASGMLAAKGEAGRKAQAACWREPTGVKKEGDKYVAIFNKKRLGVYFTREAAYFVWNAAAGEWNDTHAASFDMYALYELSPEDTAKFESRDPRWRDPTGVRKDGDKYVVFFNGKRICTYSTLEAAYFVWNAAAGEWNDKHADPFDKYALFPSMPGDEAR